MKPAKIESGIHTITTPNELSHVQDILVQALPQVQIVGKGNWGIVVQGPTKNKVWKIAKNLEANAEIQQEYTNQCAWYKEIRTANLSFPLSVPEPNQAPLSVSQSPYYMFEMQKIQGLDTTNYDLIKMRPKEYELFQKTGQPPNTFRDWIIEQGIMTEVEILAGSYSALMILECYHPKEHAELKHYLESLERKGFKHLDLHGGNVMIQVDESGKISLTLVDFGDVRIPPQIH